MTFVPYIAVMQLTPLDYFIIALYMVFSLGIGVIFTRRAGKSVEEFFISGRALPWWLAGTSMVATTFAADTPLAVTGIVITNGIAGNWLWWSYALGGALTVFFYARLWRRARVITDVELIELRYGGKPASILRGFRALYLALPINCIIMGWVISAMVTVLHVSLGIGTTQILIASIVITGIYCILAGLWGVAITDFVQFIIAMGGCIILAILAIGDVGGMSALKAKLIAQFGGSHEALNFIPSFKATGSIIYMPALAFITYLCVTWWASWYPGAEPGGGGYVVQRMASCKDEKHSLLATLWFQIAHYALRPWPWIVVALVALVSFPELRQPGANPNEGFPMVMAKVLPPGLRGLLIVAFFAAFMSTLATQINWGASYIVNDFYKRFIHPDAEPKHYTRVSRIATVILLILGSLVSLRVKAVEDAWKLMLALGAGTGMVFILRWYWWRINAWSEISSMLASFIIATVLYITKIPLKDYEIILIAAFASLAVWLFVTFVTAPERPEVLERFYRLARPGGVLW
ncbi:MAG: Na+:solute symporter, partial [Candidatus Sumerlaeia bacterium]|nr:Na+:solute symporter [Candidatus Sumerlaeia bacterium]